MFFIRNGIVQTTERTICVPRPRGGEHENLLEMDTPPKFPFLAPYMISWLEGPPQPGTGLFAS